MFRWHCVLFQPQANFGRCFSSGSVGLRPFEMARRRNMIFNKVKANEVLIVERFGRFNRVMGGGTRFVFPFFEKISAVLTLDVRTFETEPAQVLTKDGVSVNFQGNLHVQIDDAVKVLPYLSLLPREFTKVFQAKTSIEVGKLLFEQCLTEIETVKEHTEKFLQESLQTWGLKCTRCDVLAVSLPPGVQEELTRQAVDQILKKQENSTLEELQEKATAYAKAQNTANSILSEGDIERQANKVRGELDTVDLRIQTLAKASQGIANIIQEHGEKALHYALILQSLKASEPTGNVEVLSSSKQKAFLPNQSYPVLANGSSFPLSLEQIMSSLRKAKLVEGQENIEETNQTGTTGP